MKLVKLLLLSGVFVSFTGQTQELTLSQVLQKVVDHYPSVKTAAIQVDKARQENIKVESQLSWLLNSNVGFARGTSTFGTATDRYNAGASLNRNLENGDILGFNAALTRDDAVDTFAPSIPNPLTKTRADVNYRMRLAQGADNPQYSQNKQAALAGEQIAISDRLSLYDQLATQVIDLYLAAAITQARINSLDKTIQRGIRLKKYIDDEFKLGLSEEKDVLQVDARLSINEADKKSLQVVWQQQLIALNRLMGRSWEQNLQPDVTYKKAEKTEFNALYSQAQQHSPALKSIAARLNLADSDILLSRDKRKDELDMVLFLGNEFNQGDTATGSLDESEVIGGISLEFNRGLDKSGFDAALRQAHYARGIALQDKKQVLEDLQYNISSLQAEIISSEQALSAFARSIKAEQKKLNEATQRYKDGRIETDLIIDFESQLANAELSYDLQLIELLRRDYQLELLRGSIWDIIVLPQFTLDEYADESYAR